MAVIKKDLTPIPQPKLKTVAEKQAESEFNANYKSEEMKRLSVDIPKNLFVKLKTYCIENDMSISDVVRQLLTDKL